MILRVIQTTDHQWLGREFDIPNPIAMIGQKVPMTEDVSMTIGNVEVKGDIVIASNPNYIVKLEVVG